MLPLDRRREDCVAEQMFSHQTYSLTEGAHDDLTKGTHDGGDCSEDDAQLEELFHSGSVRGETAGGRDSRESSRNRLLNNLPPTKSKVMSERYGKGDGGSEEPMQGRSNSKNEGSSNIEFRARERVHHVRVRWLGTQEPIPSNCNHRPIRVQHRNLVHPACFLPNLRKAVPTSPLFLTPLLSEAKHLQIDSLEPFQTWIRTASSDQFLLTKTRSVNSARCPILEDLLQISAALAIAPSIASVQLNS
eukprot:gene5780-6002_t